MSFISLLTGKLHKRKLAGYTVRFYRDLPDNVDSAVRSDFYGRIANDVDVPLDDVQKYLLATSDFAKGMQDDINLYVTRDRFNKLALGKS